MLPNMADEGELEVSILLVNFFQHMSSSLLCLFFRPIGIRYVILALKYNGCFGGNRGSIFMKSTKAELGTVYKRLRLHVDRFELT